MTYLRPVKSKKPAGVTAGLTHSLTTVAQVQVFSWVDLSFIEYQDTDFYIGYWTRVRIFCF